MTATDSSTGELEVHFKPDTGKAVIEGKTVVPFQSFVTLVLQRKVLPLCKQWGKDPVVVGSELLTSLASAPQDSRENLGGLVTVSLAAGALLGVAGLALAEIVLLLVQTPLGLPELSILLGSVAGLVVLLFLLMQLQRKPKGEKVLETMEQVSSFLRAKR